MEDNNRINLTSGQVYITESGYDAFIVRSGVLLVYVVTYERDSFGKRVFLYEAKQGEVIPGFCYTDMNYENRRFLFTSRAGAALGIIRGGSTKKLRKNFFSKLKLDDAYVDNFNEAITDSIRTAEATNEAFIARSESMRDEIEQDILKLVQEKKKKPRRDRVSEKRLFLPTCRLIRMSLNAMKPLANIGIFVIMLTAALLIQVLPFGILKLKDFAAVETSQGAVPMPIMFQMLFIMLIAVTGSSVIRSIGKLISEREASRLADTAEQQVIGRFFSLQYRYFREHESAETANMMLHVKQVVAKVMTGTHSFFFAIIASAACLIMCLWLSPVTAAAGVVLLAILMAVYVFLMRTAARYREKAILYGNRSSSLMYQFITGIVKIRLSGAEEKATLEYLQSFAEKEDAEEVRYANVHFSHDVFSIAVVLFAAIFCLVSGWSSEPFRLERWAAFLCSFTLMASYHALAMRSFLSIGEEYEFVRELTDDLDQYAENTEGSEKTVPPVLDGEIDIHGLSFSYGEEEHKVFDKLDLHIRAGEYVAIVGESGCGKSTLFKLLLGFEIPDEGDITYSGQLLSKTDLYLLRKQIGVVLQDGKLISGTIEENIAVTKPDATKGELRKAIHAVGLERDLDTMPMGTQTVLTEDSEMISGGQRQKILIARALLNDPRILFFDEATGALDNLSQKVITDTLKATDATRVMIAHRLSTVVDCDRIIVLGGGGIAEEGAFDELMAKKGVFYSMAQRQMLVTESNN